MENYETGFGFTAFELLDFIKNSDITICDLRKKEEFAKGHIKNSILAKYAENNLLDVPKYSKVILVSKDENQSKKMVYALRPHNIDAYYLIGGINSWPYRLYYTNISYVGTGYP